MKNRDRTALFLLHSHLIALVVFLFAPHDVFAARLFSSGCELQGDGPDGAAMIDELEWDHVNSTPAMQIDTSIKRSGLSSCASILNSAGKSSVQHVFASPASTGVHFARFYFYIETLPSHTTDIAWFGDKFAITLSPSGNIALFDSVGGTSQGTHTVPVGQWRMVEVRYTSALLVGQAQYSFWEGPPSGPYSGGSFVSSGAPGTIDRLRLGFCSLAHASLCNGGAGITGKIYFDDIAINDVNGTSQNDRPGTGAIVHMQPDSAGAVNNCSSGATFANVDEPTPDDAVTFCKLTSIGSKLGVNLESSTNAGIGSGDTIALVQFGARERPDGADAVGWRLFYRPIASGAYTYGSSVNHEDGFGAPFRTNGDTVPRNYTLTSYVNPGTSLPWTPTGASSLDTMNMGIDMTFDDDGMDVTALWALVEISGTGSPPPPPPPAGADLKGFAWSPVIGWVSFNCADVSCTGTNYKVSVSSNASRELYGYAWSSAVGWISFNSADLVGCPSGTCKAEMSSSSGVVTGWARALSAVEAGTNAGGWGGWIKFRGPTYGVLANGKTWTGYAWGGGRVTGSGEFSPRVGGNASIGWISFRGQTGTSTLQSYGVSADAGTVAEGPRVVSCGVNTSAASLNSNVTWSAVVSPSLTGGPFTYLWSLPGGTAGDGATSASVTASYSTAGLKRGSVIITDSTGVSYPIDCDATSIAGSPSPWHPEVFVGRFQLDSVTSPVTMTGTFQAGVGTVYFDGGVMCYEGAGTNEDCDATPTNPLTIPFDNVFQIVQGHQTTQLATAYHFATATPTVTSIFSTDYPSSSVDIDGEWKIPEAACPYNSPGNCEFSVRACADVSVAPAGPGQGNEFSSWDGVVCEPGETSCKGAHNDNSCFNFYYFFVTPAPPPPIPPPTGGTCKATPGVTQLGKTVTWDVVSGSIANGTPPFTYRWEALPTNTGADALLPYAFTTTSSFTKTYTNASPATKRARVTVRDAEYPTHAELVIDCSGVVRLQKIEEF